LSELVLALSFARRFASLTGHDVAWRIEFDSGHWPVMTEFLTDWLGDYRSRFYETEHRQQEVY
jgi:hypothetical protein